MKGAPGVLVLGRARAGARPPAPKGPGRRRAANYVAESPPCRGAQNEMFQQCARHIRGPLAAAGRPSPRPAARAHNIISIPTFIFILFQLAPTLTTWLRSGPRAPFRIQSSARMQINKLARPAYWGLILARASRRPARFNNIGADILAGGALAGCARRHQIGARAHSFAPGGATPKHAGRSCNLCAHLRTSTGVRVSSARPPHEFSVTWRPTGVAPASQPASQPARRPPLGPAPE